MAGTLKGTVALADLRPLAAAALEPQTDADPPVLVDVVDSLTPPVLMLLWGDPWLEPAVANRPVMGSCLFTANLQVLCVGGRLEPGPGIDTIEQLVSYVLGRLDADIYPWPLRLVTALRQQEIGGITYLAARVNYAVPVTV
ncbi:MAG: hypothetical protein J2P43_01530 [Candidatus Dormibacteraeota bacterium]|nr:hypothetical protein [Candidatus Dormibacteraeota bacterium]